MIDIRRLRVLRAVAYYGTVTAAAEAVHLTPSAASQQIRQLGHELGVALLEQHGRRVRLTPAARVLLARADTITEHWQQAEAELAQHTPTPTGPLVLCGIPTAVSAFLGPVTPRLQHRWPRLDVRIREAEPLDCYDLVFDGSADLGVTLAGPGQPARNDRRFDQQRLHEDPYDLLTAPEHRLAGRDGLTLADLSDEPWIVSMPGTAPREMTLALCAAAGFSPTVAHEALEWAAVANLVGLGLGIALVPRLAQLPAEPAVVRTALNRHTGAYRQFLTITRRGSRAAPGPGGTLDELHTLAEDYDRTNYR